MQRRTTASQLTTITKYKQYYLLQYDLHTKTFRGDRMCARAGKFDRTFALWRGSRPPLEDTVICAVNVVLRIENKKMNSMGSNLVQQ